MNLITVGDITDTWYKLRLRGLKFILSKFNFFAQKRVESVFNVLEINSANYWDIPEIKRHWNQLISGEPDTLYEDYVFKKFLYNKKNLKMLSIGCGGGHHEIRFAKYENFDSIIGIDLAPKLIEKANKVAREQGYLNLKYELHDFYKLPLNKHAYDVIHFYASLHHFKPIDLILQKVKNALKKDGYLIIHEYVGPNRFQFPKEQIKVINELLNTIPKQLCTKYLSNKVKQKVYTPGLLRMILADPSEAADSQSIRPVLKKLFTPIKEVELGGNIMHLLFKDIAHHFVEPSNDAMAILKYVFEAEKDYRQKSQSDFIFGVYRFQI